MNTSTTTTKPRKPTIEERAASMLTGEEYRVMATWAQWLTRAALLLVALIVWQGVRVAYVVAAQVAAQTSLIRPLTPEQRRWIRATGGRGVTLASTAHMRPAGWIGKLPAALTKCQTVKTCPDALNNYARYIMRTSPEAIRAQKTAEKTGGAAILIAVSALFASGEAARWQQWERGVQARMTRNRKRAAQSPRRAA